MIELKSVLNNDKDLLELVRLLDNDLNSRYGNLQAEYDKYNKLDSIDAAIVAYSNLIPIGCGCFKSFDKQTVEIKRMFVKQEYRGKGISILILDQLEQTAKQNGFSKSILETGIGQPEAIRFYNKSGYKQIDNFGQYIGNINSVCMSKLLE